MNIRYLTSSFAFALLLSGCPICPDGELLVVEGRTNLAPLQTAQFVFRYGDDTYSSPTACGGHWYVNGFEGGTDTLGRVTSCGKYTAPAQPPPEQPVSIEASQFGINECSDCCPYANIEVHIVAP